ncbi:hypothetical protein SAY87_001772 [Trapa incisa]|uniref:Uncharacterized protein n=1 Tax=Trapa incisa TaxID=236973 RepID=A0AAN7JYL5_9MYRT|nr:hypothetical protein SAY87_001772 [Trapa incisa]
MLQPQPVNVSSCRFRAETHAVPGPAKRKKKGPKVKQTGDRPTYEKFGLKRKHSHSTPAESFAENSLKSAYLLFLLGVKAPEKCSIIGPGASAIIFGMTTPLRIVLNRGILKQMWPKLYDALPGILFHWRSAQLFLSE